MSTHSETTAEKIRRLFKSEFIEKLAAQNLMIVNKEDFEYTMNTYANHTEKERLHRLEVARLNQRIRQLEQQISDSRQHKLGF